MKDLILVCDGLFGLEILDSLETGARWYDKHGWPQKYRPVGYVSDDPACFRGLPCPVPRLGDLDTHPMRPEAAYVLAICEPEAKRAAVSRIKARGGRFETLIAPMMLARNVDAGEGAVVDAYSIADGVKIGAFATVSGAMLADGPVGDYATVLRFANVIGEGVGEGAYVGNHVFVPHGKSIGAGARAEDGAVVARSVRPGVTVGGIPARNKK